jgi:hypothetical protein
MQPRSCLSLLLISNTHSSYLSLCVSVWHADCIIVCTGRSDRDCATRGERAGEASYPFIPWHSFSPSRLTRSCWADRTGILCDGPRKHVSLTWLQISQDPGSRVVDKESSLAVPSEIPFPLTFPLAGHTLDTETSQSQWWGMYWEFEACNFKPYKAANYEPDLSHLTSQQDPNLRFI